VLPIRRSISSLTEKTKIIEKPPITRPPSRDIKRLRKHNKSVPLKSYKIGSSLKKEELILNKEKIQLILKNCYNLSIRKIKEANTKHNQLEEAIDELQFKNNPEVLHSIISEEKKAEYKLTLDKIYSAGLGYINEIIREEGRKKKMRKNCTKRHTAIDILEGKYKTHKEEINILPALKSKYEFLHKKNADVDNAKERFHKGLNRCISELSMLQHKVNNYVIDTYTKIEGVDELYRELKKGNNEIVCEVLDKNPSLLQYKFHVF